MNIRNISYLVGFTVLAGCATSSNIDTRVQHDYSQRFDKLEQTLHSLNMDMNSSSSILSDKLSNLKMNKTTIVYSSPDSTGRQYPVEISTTDINREDKQLTRMEENMSLVAAVLTQKVDSLTQVVNSVLEEKQKTVELSWWDRYKTELFMILFIVVSVVGLIRKK